MSLLNSFPLFVRLPPELRLMTWETFTEPRTIHILHAPEPSDIRRRLRLDGLLYIHVPMLFFINFESRQVAERLYTRAVLVVKIEPLDHAPQFELRFHVQAGDELKIHDVEPSFRAVRTQISGTFLATMIPCPFIDTEKIYRWVELIPDECIKGPRESVTGDFLSIYGPIRFWVINRQLTIPPPHPVSIQQPNPAQQQDPAQQPNPVPRFFDFEATDSLALWIAYRYPGDEPLKNHYWLLAS
ncbi:hypothetical protein F5Y01DRAFT_97394 [Xylaria sp. FL0043]|nr:hypothetical protein F5Y01DRAFT_97394 [Xylaria sp. FL0043]